MEVYLKYLGIDIWRSAEDKYEFPKETTNKSKENDDHTTSISVLVDPKNKGLYEWNRQAKNVILCGLYNVEFNKFMQSNTMK